MSTNLSSYFNNELADWISAIEFYAEETENISRQLGEVVSRNSIVGIAAMVETKQEMLYKMTDTFYKIQIDIEKQDHLLRTDSTLVEDDSINDDINDRQESIRNSMQEAEKKFIDVKFDCYRFISQTLKK